MFKRRLTWCVLAMLLVLLAAGIGWLTLVPAPSPVHVTAAAYVRVKNGMTEAEVEASFGGPAGDYTTGRASFCEELSYPLVLNMSPRMKTWKSDEGCVVVDFHPEGYVISKLLLLPRPSPPRTFLERLLSQLGL